MGLSERKLTSHTESTLKRREPGILKLAKVYNDHCKHMQTLVRERKAPRNALLPQAIDTQKLFALDVDDDIWQDAGLDDDNDKCGVPLWLGSESTRQGIKHRLLLDRCVEEEHRLIVERGALQEWMHEEWVTMVEACTIHSTLFGNGR